MKIICGTDFTENAARGIVTEGAGTLAAKLVRKAPTKVLLVSERGTTPFHKVVACVDFSPTSGLAVEPATRVAGREGGEIHWLNVFDPPWQRSHYRVPTPAASQNFKKQYTDSLPGRLGEFVNQHSPCGIARPCVVGQCADINPRGEGFNLRCVLLPRSSYDQGIAQYAKEVKADLFILGTRGRQRCATSCWGPPPRDCCANYRARC